MQFLENIHTWRVTLLSINRRLAAVGTLTIFLRIVHFEGSECGHSMQTFLGNPSGSGKGTPRLLSFEVNFGILFSFSKITLRISRC